MRSITEDNIGDMLADKVGRLGVHEWLVQMAEFLGAEISELLPNQLKATHIVEWPHFGLNLTLHYHANAAELTLSEARWIISDAILNRDWAWRWPFDIDMDNCTPEQLASKLSQDISGSDQRPVNASNMRQTYFLSDGRAVGITWNSDRRGFQAMHICRLGLPLEP
jgi:hypothetical protein